MAEIITQDNIETKEKFDKESINIIRTLQRNNVQLIHIADNKAAVLLSLNAIMLTLLIPNVISNLNFILDYLLYFPVIILAITSLFTVCISSFVLMPSRLKNHSNASGGESIKNQFYSGNISRMESSLFYEQLKITLKQKNNLQAFLAEDLYYSGKRLGSKMKWIRFGFYTFLIGLTLAAITTIIAGANIFF